MSRFTSEVERTDIQAIVASEDLVSHTRLQVLRDDRGLAAQFDREVGNAACGVDDVRLGDGPRRTGLNTERAAPAQIGCRLIGFEIQRRQDFPEQQPGAMLGRDEIRMFADPTETRPFGPCLFHDRARVGVRTGFGLGVDFMNELFQYFEPGVKQLMVILSPRIPSDAPIARLFVGAMFGQVVDSH